MNDANADVIRHVTLDLGTGARLHSYLERQIRFAESSINDFPRRCAGLQ